MVGGGSCFGEEPRLVTVTAGFDGGKAAGATDLGRRTQGAWKSLGTGVDGSTIDLNVVSLGRDPLLASSTMILAWNPVVVCFGETSARVTTGKVDEVDLAGSKSGGGLCGL